MQDRKRANDGGLSWISPAVWLSTIRVSSLVPPTEVGGSSVDPFCDSGIADYQWCQHCQREQHAVREPCAGETDPLR